MVCLLLSGFVFASPSFQLKGEDPVKSVQNLLPLTRFLLQEPLVFAAEKMILKQGALGWSDAVGALHLVTAEVILQAHDAGRRFLPLWGSLLIHGEGQLRLQANGFRYINLGTQDAQVLINGEALSVAAQGLVILDDMGLRLFDGSKAEDKDLLMSQPVETLRQLLPLTRDSRLQTSGRSEQLQWILESPLQIQEDFLSSAMRSIQP